MYKNLLATLVNSIFGLFISYISNSCRDWDMRMGNTEVRREVYNWTQRPKACIQLGRYFYINGIHMSLSRQKKSFWVSFCENTEEKDYSAWTRRRVGSSLQYFPSRFRANWSVLASDRKFWFKKFWYQLSFLGWDCRKCIISHAFLVSY